MGRATPAQSPPARAPVAQVADSVPMATERKNRREKSDRRSGADRRSEHAPVEVERRKAASAAPGSSAA